MFIIGMGLPKMVWAEEKDTVRAFDIPAQPLRTSLERFAEQANVQMLYTLDVVEGVQSQAVQGSYPPEQALKILLKGTGLTGERTDTNTITVIKAAASSGAISDGIIAVEAEPQQKPIKVPEIQVKEVRRREHDTTSYVSEDASTATRTETPLIQVPQAVEIVTRKVIEDQRAIRLEQAIRNASGLVIDVSEGGSAVDRAYCRGFQCGYFKNNLRNESSEQVLSFRDIANIQRLEVLKGPASVLYGRGEPGGIINILTKQPQAERYHSIEQILGSYGYYRTMFDSTGPLDKDKKFLYRINFAYENRESYRDFLFGQRYFVAPVFTWIAGNNTTITVEGEYIRDRRVIDGGFPAIGTGIAPLPRNRYLGEPSDNIRSDEGRVSLRVNHRFTDSWRIESQFRADEARNFGPSVGSNFLLPDNRTLDRFIQGATVDVSSYYWRNDLIGKVSTGSIQHRLLTGFEIGRQSTSWDNVFAPFGSIDIFNPVYNQTSVPDLRETRISRVAANSVAGYIQDEITLFEKLHVLIGGRGDYLYQHTTVSNVTTKAEDFGFSPRVGVNYQLIPQVAVYANVTRSFQPIFNPYAAASNILKPTTAWQYEAGIKTDIVPGRLTSTLAVYRILKEDALAADPDNPFLFVQTGAQRSQGIEFNLRAQILPGWNLIATYAYTDARVAADTTIPVGNRLPFVPRNSGSIWSTYDFQNGPLQGFGVGGGMFAVGERAGDLNNSFELPGYVRADGALYYRKQNIFNRTNLVAQVNIQNLLNQEYFYGGFGYRGGAAFPGAPISAFGSVKLEFY